MRAVFVLVLTACATLAAGLGWSTLNNRVAAPDAVQVSASLAEAPVISALTPSSVTETKVSAKQPDPFPVKPAAPKSTLQPKTRGLSSVTAQSYSNKCRVPNGSICYVPAQPVGASCTCPGDQKGVIVW